jgi:amidase
MTENVVRNARSEFDRRSFLRTGLAGGAFLTLGAGCSRSAPPGDQKAEAPALPSSGFELEEATLDDLRRRLDSGQESARSLVDAYLARIAALDRQGPSLHHVLEINPDAASIADALDTERRARGARGPLHGIPVLVKDNVGTGDRQTTTAGSLALEGAIAPSDAFVVAKLRQAGAVILGKTNMSEWANFRSTKSTSGWSGRGGQAKNPYALDRNPSGSSSGTGGAIAANLAPVGIGTETDGSIVSPAGCCGLVGVKPTLGLVSRAGIIPIAHSQDTAGPMTRTVRDAAILLSAMAGVDAADETTRVAAGRSMDFAAALDPRGLEGARIGIVRQHLMGYSRHADRIAEAAIDVLKKAGAVVIDPADLPGVNEIGDPEFEVLLYEFKADLTAFLAALGPSARVRTLDEIIAFNSENSERELPYFGQDILEMAAKKGPLTDRPYREALRTCRRLSRTEGIDAVMDRHRLDALFAPTGAPAGLTDLVNGDSYPGGSSTPAAVAGYPHITVPGGAVFGLPVGVSFFGRRFSEPTLFRLAYAFEQATKHRRPPAFAATVNLNGI